MVAVGEGEELIVRIPEKARKLNGAVLVFVRSVENALKIAAALDKDGELLDVEERARIDAVLASLRQLRAGEDHRAIKAGIDAVARATDEFAARRMDNSIRSALAGHKVDELNF